MFALLFVSVALTHGARSGLRGGTGAVAHAVPALTAARPLALRGGTRPVAAMQPAAPAIAGAARVAGAFLCGVVPIASFFAINEMARVGLLAAGIAVPSSLVAMLAVFATLCALSATAPLAAAAAAGFFAPGSALLNKWLAAFYVPSLLAFPLTAPDLASPQIAGCMGLCVVGLAANIAATATACQLLGGPASSPALPKASSRAAAAPAAAPVTQPVRTDTMLAAAAAACGAVAALASFRGLGLGSAASSGVVARLAIDGCVTLATFSGLRAAGRLPKQLRTAVHPIFVSTAAAAAAVSALSAAGVGAPMSVLRAHLFEPALRSAGGIPLVGGGALTALLAPTVVGYGLQMYTYRKLMASRAKQIFGSLAVGSAFGLCASVLAARTLRLAPALRLALLPRSVTTPLALEMGRLLGADAAIVILAVFTTGLVVITAGPAMLDRMGCTDPVARGLALGGAGHGGGVLALAGEEEALPFAATAMALNGAASVLLLCVPPVRRLLIKAALG